MAKKRSHLFYNCTIHTCDDVEPHATWLMVRGSRIQHIGSGDPPPCSSSIDLGGATVVPGFVDAHVHLFQTGMDEMFVSMKDATCLKDVEELLTSAPGGPRTWLFASGYEEEKLTDVDYLTRDHLDRIERTRPVWINRVDYHSAVVNTAGLRRLNIPHGMHGLVMKGGQPNGIIRSHAFSYARPQITRSYPVEMRDRAVRTAASLFVRNGITSVHALEGGAVFGDEGISTLLKREHTVPLNVTLFVQEKNVVFTQTLGFRHLGGCIDIDGSIGSYTAALARPYEGMTTHRGVLYEKEREFNSFVEEAHAAGIQLSFHAIGSRAIELLLNAYAHALDSYPRYNHRHRIEHFELATDEQIRRARDMGIVACMQPNFEYFWGGPEGMYAMRLGDRWRTTNRFRTILDAGVRIAGSSDSMVTPPKPLLGIHAAVNHPNEEQRISVGEAFKMMTVNGAYAAFKEAEYGSLVLGKNADFVVLDRDPFAVPAHAIKDINVLETWHHGKRSWCAAATQVSP